MIKQPVVMEPEFGKLISSLTPESKKQVITVINDSRSFRFILGVLGLDGRVDSDRYPNIEFEVAVEYSFQGLSTSTNDGYAATYYSRVWICPTENGSDHDWAVEEYHLYDRFYDDLNKIMETPKMIEVGLPSIEEVNLVWIDVTTEKVVQKGKYWRIRRTEC